MGDDEGRGALGDAVAEARTGERLRALTEYAELRARWLRGEHRPGDRQRRTALAVILDRTGGIPHELRWPKRR